MPLLGKVPLTMPLREQADSGLPLVIEDPDDPASQAIRHIARGLVAMAPAAPVELPVLQLVEVAPAGGAAGNGNGDGNGSNGNATPTESAEPVGMSLPMRPRLPGRRDQRHVRSRVPGHSPWVRRVRACRP